MQIHRKIIQQQSHIIMIVLQRLQQIESYLRVLRTSILILSIGQLFVTLFNSNQDTMASLIITIFSILLYIQKHLSSTTYKLFILVLLVDGIYTTGHFLQMMVIIDISFLLLFINSYTIFVISFFILILWRHYQLAQITDRILFGS